MRIVSFSETLQRAPSRALLTEDDTWGPRTGGAPLSVVCAASQVGLVSFFCLVASGVDDAGTVTAGASGVPSKQSSESALFISAPWVKP